MYKIFCIDLDFVWFEWNCSGFIELVLNFDIVFGCFVMALRLYDFEKLDLSDLFKDEWEWDVNL